MRFAKWVYRIAGIYGLIALLPQYFLRDYIGQQHPPAVTHPEFFYGFVGIGAVFQLVFLLISTDVRRYRPLMPITWLEKLSFGLPVIILFALGELSGDMLAAGCIDLTLGVLFFAAWRTSTLVPLPPGEVR